MNDKIRTLFIADGRTIKELFITENDELLYLDKTYKHVSTNFRKYYIEDNREYEVRTYNEFFDITDVNFSFESEYNEPLNFMIIESYIDYTNIPEENRAEDCEYNHNN